MGEHESKESLIGHRNTGLLSFGEAEEVPVEPVKTSKKGIGRQDCEFVPDLTSCLKCASGRPQRWAKEAR